MMTTTTTITTTDEIRLKAKNIPSITGCMRQQLRIVMPEWQRTFVSKEGRINQCLYAIC